MQMRIRKICLALVAAAMVPFVTLRAQQSAPAKAPPKSSAAQAPPPAPAPEPAVDRRMLEVRRVCIQRFGEDALGFQVQEMVIARLFEARRFTLTENCDNADFILKGTITERSDRAFRSESEGVGFDARASASESDRQGSVSASHTARGSSHESLASSEVKVQAAVTLRVVARDGEILWATSQESAGGKTKSAIGDAAERAVRRLLRDIERAEKAAKSP